MWGIKVNLLLVLIICPESSEMAFFNEEKEFIRWANEGDYQVLRNLHDEGLLGSISSDSKEMSGYEFPEPHEGE